MTMSEAATAHVLDGPRAPGAAVPRQRAAAPDMSAERLVDAYADLILRVSFTYLRTTADAEDICQDVLIKLITRGRPFRSLEHERAWVIRVTINACRDLLRRRAAREPVALDDVPEPAAPAHLSEEGARERQTRVLAAVTALPEAQREAIYLHYYEGYTIHGIGLLTGRTDAAVAQALSRGRKQLRRTLKEDFDEHDA